MKQIFIVILMSSTILIGFLIGCGRHEKSGSTNNRMQKTWSEYLGGPHRALYSSLKQINVSNVKNLEIAWKYTLEDTGTIETNPTIIGDTLYGMSAKGFPFAINAATGKEYWRKKSKKYNSPNTQRGLAYWAKGKDRRNLYTHDSWLYAVDATTGKTISSFGDSGRVSLKTGLNKSAQNKRVYSTSPGTIYKDLIIMPLTVSEGAKGAKGYIQAFNIRTGNLAWVFNTIPKPGEYGYDTWPKNAYKNPDIGGANSWAGMAIDRKRGIVYVPTGSAAMDYWGGNRKGRNLFTNTLLALDAGTGKRIWSYQLVHHDILDRDLPASPSLLTVTHNGKKVDAVAQITKQGYVFLFNRETGKPLFPIKEKPVPQSNISGEQSWPTQPVPTKPAPFARITLAEDDINPHAENYEELIKIFRNSRSNGPFTPISKQGTLVFPGLDGGGEWGGAAVDPDGILYINSSAVPWYVNLVPKISKEKLKKLSLGHKLYINTCSRCHGTNRKGLPNSGIPPLVNIKKRHPKDYVERTISNGRNMMPSFGSVLSKKETQAIVAFLFGEEKQRTGNTKKIKQEPSKEKKSAVSHMAYHKRFLTKDGYPAITPPWGTLSAINMNTGEYVWRDTLGTHPELEAEYGTAKTGALNFGGPIATAGNLLFIGATPDSMFKAYDKRNGKLLWKTKLPAPGFATPATYEVNGKQYVVIACGGTNQLFIKARIVYVAFALPN